MFPKAFQSSYPSLSEALTAMVGLSEAEPSNKSEGQEIASELCEILANQAQLDDLFQSIWAGVDQSQGQFLQFSTKAYHYLGVSDDVRDFMGELWWRALQSWKLDDAQSFLRLILEEQRFFLFEALDFAPLIFRHVRLPAKFMAAWLRDARKAVGNDLYQRGLWRCIENYSRCQPEEALLLIELSQSDTDDTQFNSTLARMLNWVRAESSSPEVAVKLKNVERLLRLQGGPSLRGIYFESWAFAARSTALAETRALALRDELLSHGVEQHLNWAFLLAQNVEADRTAWNWIYRELQMFSLQLLDPQTLYWVRSAALSAWASAREDDSIDRIKWADLFISLPPLEKEQGGIWQQIEHAIINGLSKDLPAVQNFFLRLAAHSGKAWATLLEEEREHFSWLHSNLRDTGHAISLVTDLCLAPERSARRIGVKMFKECALKSLLPDAVAQATEIQLELLIHQVALQIGDHKTTARIHACIAFRVDELGGELEEVFYEEVVTQAMNTDGYRVTLKKHARDHVKLVECVREAHLRLDATIAAVKSPALQMMVPGRNRAESLSMRRFGRQIQAGMSKYSILSQLCTTVPLLYGRSWRMQDAGGNLTSTSELQKSEVSMEMPRLEMIAPELMRLRRLVASTRISQLQTEENDQ